MQVLVSTPIRRSFIPTTYQNPLEYIIHQLNSICELSSELYCSCHSTLCRYIPSTPSARYTQAHAHWATVCYNLTLRYFSIPSYLILSYQCVSHGSTQWNDCKVYIAWVSVHEVLDHSAGVNQYSIRRWRTLERERNSKDNVVRLCCQDLYVWSWSRIGMIE